MYRFVVPLRPRGSKNSRPIFKNKKTGKMFLGKDKKLHQYFEDIEKHLKEQMADYKDVLFPLTGPLQAKYVFCFNKKQRADIDNAQLSINDGAQKSGLIENDKMIKKIVGVEVKENFGSDQIIFYVGKLDQDSKPNKVSLNEALKLFKR